MFQCHTQAVAVATGRPPLLKRRLGALLTRVFVQAVCTEVFVAACFLLRVRAGSRDSLCAVAAKERRRAPERVGAVRLVHSTVVLRQCSRGACVFLQDAPA